MRRTNLILSLIVFFSAFLVFFFSGNAGAGTGLSISFGGEYGFNNASTSDIALAGLSQTKFVAAYRDGGGNLNYGRALIGEISGKVISYGPEYDFNPTNTSDIAMARLSENKFAVAYQDTGNYKYGGLIIGEVDGNNISFGQEYFFNENVTSNISLGLLSEDKVIVAYDDESSKSHQTTAIIGTIAGTEVSFGQKQAFNYSAADDVRVVVLSENRFVVVYEDFSSSKQGVAVIGDISGDDISFSQEYVFNPTETNSISAVKTGENAIAVFYDDDGESSNQGRAVLATVSDSLISYSGDFIFNSAITGSVSASLFDSDKILVAYQNKDNSNYGEIILAQVSGGSINFDSNKSVFNPSDTEIISVSNLSKENVILIYRKAANNLNYGIGIAGVITGFVEEPEPEPELPTSAEGEVGTPTDSVGAESEIIINDGDLIRNPNAEGEAQFDIYIAKIAGGKKFKRLILSPHVFKSYGHLSWDEVKDIDQSVIDQYTNSNLVRPEGGEKVYQLTPNGDTGIKEWLNISAEEFIASHDPDSIYTVNQADLDAYE